MQTLAPDLSLVARWLGNLKRWEPEGMEQLAGLLSLQVGSHRDAGP